MKAATKAVNDRGQDLLADARRRAAEARSLVQPVTAAGALHEQPSDRRSAAVKSEQAVADAATDHRGEFQLRQEERSTTADEIHMKVKALLAEATAQKLTGRAEVAENLAAERALHHETAARSASLLQMHQQAEEKLAPFVAVFTASAEVCDTMSEVAVGATDAVIEHHNFTRQRSPGCREKRAST